MGRLNAAALVLLFVATATAQVPDIGDTTDPILGGALDATLPTVESESSQDLTSEEIYLNIHLNISNAEIELVGLLFGGGKVQVDAVGDLQLEFRAIGMERLDQALQASTGDANVTVSGTFGVPVNRTALTSEELRLIGGGALLAAFQGMQEDLTKSMVENMVPGMTVLSAQFAWSNTLPAHDIRSGNLGPITDPDNATTGGIPLVELREPPLVLDASVRIQLLERLSLKEILGMVTEDDEPPAEAMHAAKDDDELLKEEIAKQQQESLLDRRAFEVLGYSQLLDVGIPPGWRIDLTLTVPDGYTIEGATDAFILAKDHRSVTYQLDGTAYTEASAQAGIVTLSNRFMITSILLGLVIFVALVLRTIVEMATLRGVYAWQHRKGLDPQRRPRFAWLQARKEKRQRKQGAGQQPNE